MRARLSMSLMAALSGLSSGCTCGGGADSDAARGTDAVVGTDALPGTDAMGATDAISMTDGTVGGDSTTGTDAAPSDAGLCDLSIVTFLPPNPGGSLMVGTLCDDLFFCVDMATGTSINNNMGTPGFSCMASSGPGPAGCTGGDWVCQWDATGMGGGPSILDQNELDAVCAITTLPNPPTSIVCIVYL